ncbi:MAG: hypothetical protein HKN31_03185 [Pricia sp.]|nr:hypothetical protein [Pricia sp.]
MKAKADYEKYKQLAEEEYKTFKKATLMAINITSSATIAAEWINLKD